MLVDRLPRDIPNLNELPKDQAVALLSRRLSQAREDQLRRTN